MIIQEVSSDERCRKNRLHALFGLGGGCSVLTFNCADETQCFDVGGTLANEKLMRTRQPVLALKTQ